MKKMTLFHQIGGEYMIISNEIGSMANEKHTENKYFQNNNIKTLLKLHIIFHSISN